MSKVATNVQTKNSMRRCWMGGSSMSLGMQFWLNNLLTWWKVALVTILKGVKSLAGFNTKLTVEQQCDRLRISVTCSPLRISL